MFVFILDFAASIYTVILCRLHRLFCGLLINLTHFLAGMRFCADLYTNGSLTGSCIFPYFDQFVPWYDENYVKDQNGYAAWWNHILYTSANNDDLAFDSFFHYFELYLREQHEIVFPLDVL